MWLLASQNKKMHWQGEKFSKLNDQYQLVFTGIQKQRKKNINKGVSLMTKVILCQLIIQNEVKETDLHCTREKGGW